MYLIIFPLKVLLDESCSRGGAIVDGLSFDSYTVVLATDAPVRRQNAHFGHIFTLLSGVRRGLRHDSGGVPHTSRDISLSKIQKFSLPRHISPICQVSNAKMGINSGVRCQTQVA